MKKITNIFLFVIYYLLSVNCYSQWVQQPSGTVSNILDVEFINRNTGWGCCQSGEIIKTTNGGLNWFQQNSGVSKILWGIHPVNENVVYCVGWFETIIKTTNGGNNWLIIRNGPSGVGASFTEVFFINENSGWMLKNMYILKTTNGGVSFDSTWVNHSYMYDIYFKDNLTGVLCGEGAVIMRSTNGGVSWNEITVPIGTEASDFFKISFVGNTGWVVSRTGANWLGGYKVYRTQDFGINWDSLTRIPYPTGTENYCVYFSNLNTGWCGGSYGHVFKTKNGGFNWIEENTQSGTGFIRSMWFYNDSVGWGVGGGGKIIHTTNSGMPVAIAQQENEIPKEFNLCQNYPNPFNNETVISFEIANEGSYKMSLYNELGQYVLGIINEYLKPGKYKINLNSANLTSGIYFYTLHSEDAKQTKKWF